MFEYDICYFVYVQWVITSLASLSDLIFPIKTLESTDF